MSGSIIFHHPLEIVDDSSRGSSLRPAQMLRAFKELGYEVVLVTGRSPERARRARRVLEDIAKGRRFDFLYGESATTPNALSDPSHLPRHPVLDARFLRSIRRAGIPVGVFYRDMFWRFDAYRRSTGLAKGTVARAFYHLDLEAYRRHVDILFLPSEPMAAFLPQRIRRAVRIVALPPGGALLPQRQPTDEREGIRLLYVGGVRPPLYSLDRVFDAVRGRSDTLVTVCCRPSEVDHLVDVPTNCNVVHAEGSELAQLYENSDLSIALLGPHPNREFAIPVKGFESVAHGVPVLADHGTAFGDLVDDLGIGVTVRSNEPLGETIAALAGDHELRTQLQHALDAQRDKHSWNARAATAATALGSLG